MNLTPIERDIYGHYRALYTYAIILYWLNEDAAASPEAISQKVWELVSQKRFYWLFGKAVLRRAREGEANRQAGGSNERGAAEGISGCIGGETRLRGHHDFRYYA